MAGTYSVYGDVRYERLATLSVSHLYNLRKSAGYQAQRVSFTKTRPVCNAIGVRKAPRSVGRLRPRLQTLSAMRTSAGFSSALTIHVAAGATKACFFATCATAAVNVKLVVA
ncbi:MAG: hypothetical protein JJD98_17805 [Polaromonas sp.]|nr:hypothetical protein [Polaromonas sp.]